MSSCVLCGLSIVKNTDKNLVDGRKGNSFKVREELLSLECEVEINSTYICRNCLCALKKRRALLKNLHEVNSSIQKIVQSKKCSAAPFPVPTPSSNQLSDSQEQVTKRVALEDFGASATSVNTEEDTCNSTLPNSTSVDQWASTLTSTPCKDKNRPVGFAAVVGPVSPIPAREPEEKKTRVQVTVEWPSRTKVNTLHEGLESLGKMLCRGTYKQIAGAVWKNPILRKYMQQLYLKEVDRECTAMCSLKNPSCLRSPS